VSLAERRALMARRVEALLGADPIVTMQPDPGDADVCCSVRLRPTGDGWWLGLVLDKSLLAERVRMGMRPTFVVHPDGETPVVSGACEARLCGRAGAPSDLDERGLAALSRLAADSRLDDPELVVLVVRLVDVRVDDGEAPLHGALPRT
jgi:hypothetical protein